MKKQLCWALAAAVVVAGAASALAADPPKSVRIGYVVSLSGVNAQGAAVTTLPAYKLWVDDVNKKGGLLVKEFNKRIPIEVTEYDDTSSAETAVRLTERLMTQDKVDFVLPPWSTGFNLATAPVYAKNGYPQLAVTANSNDAASARQADADAVLLPQRAAQFRWRAGRGAEQAQGREQDQQQDRHVQRRRPVRRRGLLRRRAGAAEGGFRDRHPQELSARRRRSHQRDQGGEGLARRHLHRLQLSARHLHADQDRDHPELQPEGLLHSGRHGVRGVRRQLQAAGRRACSASAAGTRPFRARRNTSSGRRPCSIARPTAGPRR